MSVGTVGFLGAGKIAQTITKGLLAANAVTPDRIVASDPASRNLQVLSDMGTKTVSSNKELVEMSDLVIIATKPNITGKLLHEISPFMNRDKLLVSLAAGITLEYLESNLPDCTRVIRAMPNTPAVLMHGATIFSRGRHAAEADGRLFRGLLSQLGICLEGDEGVIDAAMSVSGCGPAYAYVAIDALADGGVKMGLPRDVAIKLGAQALLGSAKMLLDSGRHPSELKDNVCSPAGTAIDAVHELEKGGFRRCLIEAVEAACLKARRLNEMQHYANK